jgi:hypothetical protein
MRPIVADGDDLALCVARPCTDSAECTPPLQCAEGACFYP